MSFIVDNKIEKSYERLDDGTSSIPLINHISLKFVTKHSELEVLIQYSVDEKKSWRTIPGTFLNTSKEQKEGGIYYSVDVNIKGLPTTTAIKKGEKFFLQVRTKISGQAPVELVECGEYYRPLDNSQNTISLGGKFLSEKDYYGKEYGYVISSWPIKIGDNQELRPELSAIVIRFEYDSGTYARTSLAKANWNNNNLKITGKTPFSGSAKISLLVLDVSGEEIKISERSYKDKASISFSAGSTFSFDKYNPHSNLNQTLHGAHSQAFAIGTDAQNIEYKYTFVRDEKKYEYPEFFKLENNEVLIRPNFTRENLVGQNKIFGELEKNGSGSIQVQITATDDFDNTAEINTNFEYDYYIEMDWENKNLINTSHLFFTISNDNWLESWQNVPDFSLSNINSYSLDSRYFCANETARLFLPPVNNPNGTQFTYEIFCAKKEHNGVLNEINFSDADFVFLTNIAVSSAKTSEIYDFQVPKDQNREKDWSYCFRVRAIDSRGKKTSFKNSTFILIGRTQSPVFKISSVSFNEVSDEYDLETIFNKKEFDLGHSFYYNNFDRSYYSAKAELLISISQNANFEDSLTSAPLQNMSDISSKAWSSKFTIPSSWGEWKTKKIYGKIEIKIEYNGGPNRAELFTVKSEPFIYFTIINGVPTVAHRKNHVGINTASFDGEHILKIAPIASAGQAPARTKIEFELLDGSSIILDLTDQDTFKTSLKSVLGL